jgi:predicted nucleic acid-binding protein
VAVRDPDDAVILAEALSAQPDLLVTGDRDLLDLPRLAGIEIATPRGFWELMTREPERR